MKPAPFDYACPTSVAEALEVMVAEGVVVLAGGQSLMPLLARRAVRPRIVCDVNRIPELAGISIGSEDVVIGAATRQRNVEVHPGLATALPVLGRAIASIGFLPVRHRGTVGGSLCHADPCAELPAVALLLDATVELRSAAGTRQVTAEEFLTGDFSTCLAPGELLTSVRFPLSPRTTRYGIVKLRSGQARPLGAVVAVIAADGVIADARIAVFGGGGPSRRLASAEQALCGRPAGDRAAFGAAARLAADAMLPLPHALHDHAARTALAAVAVQRALVQTDPEGDGDV